MICTIAVLRSPMVIRLCVTGDLDMSTTGQLDLAITHALSTGVSSLLVDLAATTFCDCAGITALLIGRRDANAHDVAFQVVNPTGSTLTVLQISGLYGLLTTRTP